MLREQIVNNRYNMDSTLLAIGWYDPADETMTPEDFGLIDSHTRERACATLKSIKVLPTRVILLSKGISALYLAIQHLCKLFTL